MRTSFNYCFSAHSLAFQFQHLSDYDWTGPASCTLCIPLLYLAHRILPRLHKKGDI